MGQFGKPHSHTASFHGSLVSCIRALEQSKTAQKAQGPDDGCESTSDCRAHSPSSQHHLTQEGEFEFGLQAKPRLHYHDTVFGSPLLLMHPNVHQCDSYFWDHNTTCTIAQAGGSSLRWTSELPTMGFTNTHFLGCMALKFKRCAL